MKKKHGHRMDILGALSAKAAYARQHGLSYYTWLVYLTAHMRPLLLIQALGREFEVDVALSSLTFEFTSESCFVMRCIL